MEFDPITFVLEVLNFLVLVWILKHFFYQPVLSVIEKRQSRTEQIINDAKNIQNEAENLKSKYETYLSDLDKEYARSKANIDEEISLEKKQRLDSLETEIATERKRRKSMEDREHSETQNALEQKAIKLGSRFASRLLERLSGVELNAKLVDMAIDELESLSEQTKESLYTALHDSQAIMEVFSAYTLDELQRKSLTNTLSKLAGHPLIPQFSEDSTLNAGVYITIGSWVFSANLRDELSFFGREFGHED